MTTSRLRPTYEHPKAVEYAAPGGPWDLPSLDRILHSAHRHGPVLVDPSSGVRWSTGDLNRHVARVAGGLRARGVGRGDVVAWQLPNWHETVLLYRACWRLGAIAGPIHHHAGAADVDRMVTVLAPALSLAAADLPLHDRPHTIGVRDGTPDFDALLDAEALTESVARPEDLAAALFTSGSSGEPKAALHTQRGFAYKARTMARVHRLTTHDAVLMPAPLAHISGALNAVLIPGVVTMKTVLMDRWDPERALELIGREQVTFMVGPPTFFVVLTGAAGFTPDRVRTLRLVSSGGAGVTSAFVEKMRSRLRARVKRTYGSTEAPTVTTSGPTDDPARAARTDGRSTGEAELRVVDPDAATDRPAGEAGELWLQGPELFVGYADATQTAAAISRDGWFRTGDLATVDETGWLTIVGRIKDIVIRGGENVSIAEVEGILEAHPAVHHAVVVGYPDERLGERVAAFVVADEEFDLETCRAWFEARGAARFKTPERVMRVPELPTLAAGKPDRTALRRRLEPLA